MLPPVFQILSADAAVAALVGRRIFRRGVAAQDVQRPYITWFLVTGTPENTLSETPTMDRMSVQIDIWATTDKGSEELATAVRDAMEPHGHMTGQPIDGRETLTKLWRIALEFDLFIPRPAVLPAQTYAEAGYFAEDYVS